MKKKIFPLVLLICLASSLYAQRSLNRFIRKYKKIENADYKRAGRIPMMFIHMVIVFESAHDKEDQEEKAVLKKILSYKVLNFSTSSQHQEVHREMKEVKFDLMKDHYEELMLVNTKGNNVNILGRIQGNNIIKDCVVLIDRDSDFSVIHITGKINLDEVKNLSNKWDDEHYSIAKK